jgi:hypothetical protein
MGLMLTQRRQIMPENLSREEMFKKAKEKVAKEQEEALKKKANSSSGNFTKEYDNLYYTGLEYGKDTIFRIWGDPLHCDEKSNESAHRVYRSRIIDDNDKICFINFPDKNLDPNFLLYRIIKKVLEVRWNNTNRDADGKGSKTFVNEKIHPTIFNRVNKNNRPEIKEERGWYPTCSIVLQGIDRLQTQWHKDNKSFRLLSKKIGRTEGKDAQGNKTFFEFPEYGIPTSLYTEIWDKVVSYYNAFENYDLLLRKKIVINNGVQDYIYEALNASGEIQKVPENLRQYVSQNIGFTDEELTYKKYDIAKLCQVTSYSKILKRLGIFIQQVDKALNTKFYDELVVLAEKEKAEYKANETLNVQAEMGLTNPTGPIQQEVKPVATTTVRVTKPVETVVETLQQPVEAFKLSSYSETFPVLKELTDAEKAIIIGWSGDDFVYSSKTLIACPSCKLSQPVEISSHCLYCGVKFE